MNVDVPSDTEKPGPRDCVVYVNLDGEVVFTDPKTNAKASFFYMMIEPGGRAKKEKEKGKEKKEKKRFLWSHSLDMKTMTATVKESPENWGNLWFCFLRAVQPPPLPKKEGIETKLEPEPAPNAQIQKHYVKASKYVRQALVSGIFGGKYNWEELSPVGFSLLMTGNNVRPPMERFWLRTFFPVPISEQTNVPDEPIQEFVPCNLIFKPFPPAPVPPIQKEGEDADASAPTPTPAPTPASGVDAKPEPEPKERVVADMIHISGGYFLYKMGNNPIPHPVVRSLAQIMAEWIPKAKEWGGTIALYEFINVPYCMACYAIDSDQKPILACKRCQMAGYCSKECQKMAWAWHKNDCVDPKTREKRNMEKAHSLNLMASIPSQYLSKDAIEKVNNSINEKFSVVGQKKNESAPAPLQIQTENGYNPSLKEEIDTNQ